MWLSAEALGSVCSNAEREVGRQRMTDLRQVGCLFLSQVTVELVHLLLQNRQRFRFLPCFSAILNEPFRNKMKKGYVISTHDICRKQTPSCEGWMTWQLVFPLTSQWPES